MKRLLHLGLLFIALLGVMGQSTAMAMVPASESSTSTKSVQVSMAGMDCGDMANPSVPGELPCKKVTLHCMAAMGCAPSAFVIPSALQTEAIVADRMVSTSSLAARLWGRSYGPEPDPPSLLT
jgi:hypothetical protein